MSGGSYNYLYCKDSSQLLSGEADEELQNMADRLAGLGYANDAAKETQSLLLLLRQSRNRIESQIERLKDVWHIVEWVDSGDSSEPDIL